MGVTSQSRALSGRLAAYLGALRISQGPLAGQPFTVLPWQGGFLELFDEQGDLALSVARKNGKTTLLAGIAAATLDGPLVQPRADTVLVAASFGQALIAFRAIRWFLFGGKKHDRKRWRVRDSANVAEIECLRTGARLAVYGAKPETAHGLAAGLCLLDEPAQWGATTRDRMLAVLRTSAGAIPGGRLVALGTRPADPEHWFEKMLRGNRALCFAAEADADPLDREAWAVANPSLPHMPHLRDALEREAKEAAADPSALAAFRALRLNAGVSDTLQSTLLDAGTWARIEGTAERAGPYALGIDLSSGAAMTAAAAYWPESGALRAFAAFPEVPGLAERERLDQVRPGLYRQMADRGELMIAGRRVVDVGILLGEVLRRWGRPAVIACDRWRERELRQSLEAVRFPLAQLVIRGQGFKDGGQDLVAFRGACLAGRVTPERSLLLRAALMEARTVSDPAANEKLSKGAQGGRRARARDDAAAASILAVAEGSRRGNMAAPSVRLVAV